MAEPIKATGHKCGCGHDHHGSGHGHTHKHGDHECGCAKAKSAAEATDGGSASRNRDEGEAGNSEDDDPDGASAGDAQHESDDHEDHGERGHNHGSDGHDHDGREHEGHGHEHDHDHAEHGSDGHEAHAHLTATYVEEDLSQEGLTLTGMDCADCALQIERILMQQRGVSSATVSFAASKMNVCFDPDVVNLSEIESIVSKLGYGIEAERGPVSKTRLDIGGMDCADCAQKVRKVVAVMPGVFKAELNFASAVLEVEHDRSHAPLGAIIDTITQLGYSAKPIGSAPTTKAFWTSKKTILTIGSGGALLLGTIISFANGPESLAIAFYVITMGMAGFYVARSAMYSLKLRTLDMNFLMTAAAIGAAAIGQWAEGATVVFLFSLGNTLQSFSLDRTRRAIQQLMKLAPDEATVLRNGQEMRVAVEQVQVGETVIIRPGERVPVDGTVFSGSSAVSEAAITGESVPADKQAGDRVFAGSHNEDGVLHVNSAEQAQNSAISRIIRLVEEAQASRAPSQQIIDRFARYYTPAVVGGALLVATIPILLGAPAEVWVYRALALLIIACPCALVISTPVSLVSAIGAATRHGVLIKDGAALEKLGTLKVIAFDKTGTLTKGRPRLKKVHTLNGYSQEEALRITASIERNSTHPLARAIVQGAVTQKLELLPVNGFSTLSGRGVKGTIDGELFTAGKPQLFRENFAGMALPDDEILSAEDRGETVVLLAKESEAIAVITLSDEARETAGATVQSLRDIGIEQVIMLTGDNAKSAARISAELKIDEYFSDLLPEGKVDIVKRIQKTRGNVGLIGDGINDAPALATADVGIGMGAIGSDITLETADVALLSDDISKIPYSVSLSRKTLRVIKQNIFVSIAVKAVFITLAPFGLITLWLAVLADTGISLLVTANGMRLFRVRQE